MRSRADIVSWSIEAAALLHLENRTRFPDVQDAAGRYNSKRAYLGAVLAKRLGVRRWRSETHVMVGAWTAEVLHVLRLRRETFRSLCPDSAEAFAAWWRGDPPCAGTASAFIVLDPVTHGRERQFADLNTALRARPRHTGYAELAALIGTNDGER